MLGWFTIGDLPSLAPHLLMILMCKHSNEPLFVNNQYMFGFMFFNFNLVIGLTTRQSILTRLLY